MPSYSKVASGDIHPARFVKLTTTADGKVTECGAGEEIYGISQEGTRTAPYTGLDDGLAAKAGETLRIYGPGDKDVMLELGGTVAVGDRIKASTNGVGVSTTSGGDEVGAIAMAAGVSGQWVPVQIIFPAKL